MGRAEGEGEGEGNEGPGEREGSGEEGQTKEGRGTEGRRGMCDCTSSPAGTMTAINQNVCAITPGDYDPGANKRRRRNRPKTNKRGRNSLINQLPQQIEIGTAPLGISKQVIRPVIGYFT